VKPAAPPADPPHHTPNNPPDPGDAQPWAFRLQVAVDTPVHAGLGDLLDYGADQAWPAGTLLRLPLGKRTVTGVVWSVVESLADASDHLTADPSIVDPAQGEPKSDPASPPVLQLRGVLEALVDLPTLPATWRNLVQFAARYYQRSLGELALGVLPPELRQIDAAGLARRLKRLEKERQRAADATTEGDVSTPTLPDLSAEQEAALAGWREATAAGTPVLLHGVTGSGKTEVYLRAAEEVLSQGRQVLMLVPEINLTPQLEARLAARFPQRRLVSLHSGLTPAQRLRHWVEALRGEADIVLGTRLAIFTPLARPGLIVVDEEHDPSFKQQEGARYSARDLAVYRARLESVPVILGSATPSLESWQRTLEGRYRRLAMPTRMGGGAMPRIRLFDMNQQPRVRGESAPALAGPLLAAIEERRARGEQSLLLLNRRGYAPVLHCGACSWKSQCPHCSAWRVFHKLDRTLRCHHCGFTERVPKSCPDCGNLDIAPIGRGTEKLEEQMAALLPEARIARFDADSTRLKGALDAQLQAVHDGEVDVLVGTQMVAKGHDFRRITLVAAVNPDGALFASDFRAAERLFALLMQAGGRAGRDAEVADRSEMWLQTWHPQHPVYAALKRHDFEAFAQSQLAERQAAGLPPFAHLALWRAEGRSVEPVEAFAQAAQDLAQAWLEAEGLTSRVFLYPPVPPVVARVAGADRLQMLVESDSRAALQHFLTHWIPQLTPLKQAHKGVLRWAVDVDPLGI
jgi:primosomal protein N' (replication factor Y) (superfamily II helicase)